MEAVLGDGVRTIVTPIRLHPPEPLRLYLPGLDLLSVGHPSVVPVVPMQNSGPTLTLDLQRRLHMMERPQSTGQVALQALTRAKNPLKPVAMLHLRPMGQVVDQQVATLTPVGLIVKVVQDLLAKQPKELQAAMIWSPALHSQLL